MLARIDRQIRERRLAMVRPLGACPLGLLLVLLAAAPAGAVDLALKRVVLSSGGVGYFEYEATVDGDATLGLGVALDQVDDVLKSLIVYDSSGSAGEITLPGREPLTQAFADLPFDQAALRSTADLLNALQGSEIRVNGDKPVAGRLVQAENITIRNPDGGSDTRLRLSLLTDAGLRQLVVKDIDTIEFVDPGLQAKVTTALTRLAAYHAQARRRLTLALHGTGQRVVRIGYVVGMPLWKATYRLSLPGDASAAAARLQGWAVLENFSGQVWDGVELTLVSGNPVTFRQALYESYYVTRPMVPVESGTRVLPPPDTGSVPTPQSTAVNNPAAPMLEKYPLRAAGVPAPAAAAPPLPPIAGRTGYEPAAIEPAAAIEETTQIAFTLPYKISVAAGQSLVVPIIDRDLPTRRVDLYQPAATQGHPLAAIELTNAGETGLPPGVLTLYQQGGDRGASYLGDARLAAFPAGEKRLLSYAVDNKVTIDRSDDTQEAIVNAAIAEGVMHLTRLNRRTTTYKIAGAAPPPALIIEYPRHAGWKLTTPNPDTAERTATAYRLPAPLDDKGNGTLTVVEEQPVEEAIELADLGDDQLGIYVAAKEIGPRVHQALAELARRRQAVARDQAELDRLSEARTRLVEDEERLRNNYTALKDDPALRKRTLDKLKESETAIDDNAAAVSKATTALSAAQGELTAYIESLKL
jgi:hypothetical protein